MRIRILPVAILTLVLVLGIKLGDLWTASPSFAQQAPAKPAAKPSATGVATKDVAAKNSGQDTQAKKSNEPDKKGAASKAAPIPKPRNSLPDDPALFTQAEIDLLQKLAERRAVIEKWSQEIEMREGLLKAAEQRIDRKVGELRKIQIKIKGMLRQYDKEQESKLKSLVKIYESMKPKDAARIFMELEMAILLDVIERMREARAAAIISKMTPIKAKDVTSELAMRRKMGGAVKAKLPSSGGDG